MEHLSFELLWFVCCFVFWLVLSLWDNRARTIIRLAKSLAVVQVDRGHEFAPLKNASGAGKDCVETCRAAFFKLNRQYLQKAGVRFVDAGGADIADADLRYERKHATTCLTVMRRERGERERKRGRRGDNHVAIAFRQDPSRKHHIPSLSLSLPLSPSLPPSLSLLGTVGTLATSCVLVP